MRQRIIPGARSQAGMTFPEMMIASAITALLIATLMAAWFFVQFSFVRLGNYQQLDAASRKALDQFTRNIRQSKVVGYFSTNSIYLTNLDGSYYGYSWDGSNTVSFTTNNTRSTFLSQCDFFCIYVWQRNPTNGFLFPYSASTQPSLTKLLDVSWRCSRTVLGKKVTTESVQTAKIVLRN